LGLDTIRALVLSIGVFSQFNQGGLSGLDMEGMYRHSMRTGAIALAIAKKEGMGLQSADKAFMAGLMHDLGKLILSANLPAAYAEIARTSQKGSMSLFEAEMEKLGATHAQVGAYLLGLWGLPDIIVEAVAFHHHPGMCPACEMTPLTAVYAANILEHQSDNLSEMDVLEGKFDADYMAALDLAERLPEWAEIVCQMDQEAQ
jgi:putative nucleotidyltransferase with HDIG domain